MALTAMQKRLLYLTLPKVMASEKQMSDLFYTHLFAVMPESEALFKAERMTQQKKLFMRTISRAVTLIDRPDVLEREMHDLIIRHKDYGVSVEQFFNTKAILMGAIEEAIGKENFDKATREAWEALYDHIMIMFLTVLDVPVTNDPKEDTNVAGNE